MNNKKIQKHNTGKREKNLPRQSTLFERINLYLELKHRLIIRIILALSFIFSFLLFDAKIDMMGDDADYIMYGYRFANNFDFPGFRGPLFPILLSPFIAIFGINIVLLKVLSGIMIIGTLFFTYKAFYQRIPALILFSCLLLLSVNSFLLFYSSAILSEPLFLFVQSLLIFFFCKYFGDTKKDVPLKKQLLQFFIIAVLVLCLTLTRTVGYAAIGVIAVYFLFFKQWKHAILTTVINAAVFGLFGLLKKLLWPSSGSAYNLNAFFTKDMYNPDMGMENVGGIIVRLFENLTNYLSKYIYQFSGLRSDIGNASIVITAIIVFAFLLGGYMAYKNNKSLFFIALHTLFFCVANFIILHATWEQERFIIVYYPMLLFVILTGFYYLLQSSKRQVHFLYIAVVIIFFLGSFTLTLRKVENNSTALRMYLSGNILYGLSPDWQNYIQISKQAAKMVPESINIAARKPNTATIYANRPFHGIYAVPSIPKDTLNTWSPNLGKTVFIIDLTSKQYPNISKYLTFVVRGITEINGVKSHISGIYEIDSTDSLLIKSLINNSEITYTSDYKQYKESFFKISDNLLYSPETMLASLKKANVKYMILASLRIYTEANTGNIINTLHRYLNIMQLKYPNLAVTKFTSGNTEPATLIELNY
jgi:hypothetical protein